MMTYYVVFMICLKPHILLSCTIYCEKVSIAANFYLKTIGFHRNLDLSRELVYLIRLMSVVGGETIMS